MFILSSARCRATHGEAPGRPGMVLEPGVKEAREQHCCFTTRYEGRTRSFGSQQSTFPVWVGARHNAQAYTDVTSRTRNPCCDINPEQ